MSSSLYYTVNTLVGSDDNNYLNGIGTSAGICTPRHMIYAIRQNRDYLYFSDCSNIIRQVDLRTKEVSLIAGYASPGDFNGDGGFSTTYFREPIGLWYHNTRDELYVADAGNHRVRRLSMGTRMIDTAVGTGAVDPATTTSAAGTSTNLYYPTGIVGDTSTNLIYLTDKNHDYVKEYNIQTGMVRNVAGGGSFSMITKIGDNGPATSAYVYYPYSLWKNGNDLFIGEEGGGRIRKVNLVSGNITTIAGYNDRIYLFGYYGDGGNATLAWLYLPSGGFVDTAGKFMYFCDSYNQVIRRIDMKTNKIEGFAGIHTSFGAFDNVEGIEATSAYFNNPSAIVYDNNRSVFYVADSQNNRIRVLTPQYRPTAIPTLTPVRSPSRYPTVYGVVAHRSSSSSSTGTTIYSIIYIVFPVCFFIFAFFYRLYIVKRQQQMRVTQDVMGYSNGNSGGVPANFNNPGSYPQPVPVSGPPPAYPLHQDPNRTFSSTPYHPFANQAQQPPPASSYPSSLPQATPTYSQANNYSNLPQATAFPPTSSYPTSSYHTATPAYTPGAPTTSSYPSSSTGYGGNTSSYGYSAVPAVAVYPGPLGSSSTPQYGGYDNTQPSAPAAPSTSVADDLF